MAFGWLGKAITGPFRGVGNLLQGKIKKAAGAFGDTLAVAGPIISATGVGIPLGTALSAAGQAGQAWNKEGSNLGSVLLGGAKGAALGYGAGKAGQAARSLFSGGAPGGVSLPGTGGAAAEGANVAGNAGTALDLGQGATSAAPAVSSAAAVPPPAPPVSLGSRLATGTSKLGGYLTKNPGVALAAGSTAANVYGATREGQAFDRELASQEADREKQREIERLGLLLNFTAGMRPRYA